MLSKKKNHPKEKTSLHPRSKHRGRYEFESLITSYPKLEPFVKENDYKDLSIDFFNAEAVKMLNTALLFHFYGLKSWDIPENYLCPPIPGRADYIHNVADLLALDFDGFFDLKDKVRCLDIGIGANCIYPIIGAAEYGWQFVGTEVDKKALEVASGIIKANDVLKDNVVLRHQTIQTDFFRGVIDKGELFDVTICNPPFHASIQEAQKGTLRKLKNLKGKKQNEAVLNFGGQSSELWCIGGENRFVKDMIYQSRQYGKSCMWFTTLVSKKDNLPMIYKVLDAVNAIEVKTMDMGQGNKISRVVAWTFMTKENQMLWKKRRWT